MDLTFGITLPKPNWDSLHLETHSFQDWCEKFLSEHVESPVKEVHGLVPGTCKHNKRLDSYMIELSALVMDIDDISPEDVGLIRKKIAPYKHIMWATYSYRPEKPKYRVLLPLSKPVPSAVWPRFWKRAAKDFPWMDPACKNPSRLYYLPSKPPGAEFPNPVFQLTGMHYDSFDLRRALEGQPAFEKTLNGEAFAQKGERHNASLSLTKSIAANHPQATEEQVYELFSPSVVTMAGFDLDDVMTAWRGAVEKYSPSEDINLEELAKTHNTDVDGLAKRWLIYSGNHVFVLDPENGYQHMDTRTTGTLPAFKEILQGAPITFERLNAKGQPVRKAPQDLLEEYGSLYTELRQSIASEESVFDPERRKLTLATARIRKELNPKYNPAVAGWLELLGGTRAAELHEWLARCPDTSKEALVLYMKGASGAGKTLLGNGLGRLWSEAGPSSGASATDRFNWTLTERPLVLVDEAAPQPHPKFNFMSWLRQVTRNDALRIERKYFPDSVLHGYPRVVLAANNDEMLYTRSFTEHDIQAIASRFLMIEVDDAPTDYLNTLAERWGVDAIPEHVLWLRESTKLPKGPQKPNGEDMVRHMKLGDRQTFSVLYSICRWLSKSAAAAVLNKIDQEQQAVVSAGKVYVQVHLIRECWSDLGNDGERPSPQEVSRALKNLGPQVAKRFGGTLKRYYEVDSKDVLMQVAESSEFDEEEIRKALEEGLTTE